MVVVKTKEEKALGASQRPPWLDFFAGCAGVAYFNGTRGKHFAHSHHPIAEPRPRSRPRPRAGF